MMMTKGAAYKVALRKLLKSMRDAGMDESDVLAAIKEVFHPTNNKGY